MTAQIFVRQLTAIDSALATFNSGVQGVSWNVDVEWRGTRDPQGMVVDFGQAKKLAKKCIDDHFDHKLLIPSAWMQPASGSTPSEHAVGCFWVKSGSGMLPGAVCAPAAHFCPMGEGSQVDFNLITAGVNETGGPLQGAGLSWLEREISRRILADSPEHVESVAVTLRPEAFEPFTHHYSYTHSLREHNGNCQRFHGHHSRIEATGADRETSAQLEAIIAEYLNGRYLVGSSYLSAERTHPQFQELRSALEHWLSVAQKEPETRQSSEPKDFEWAHLHYVGSQGPVWLLLPADVVELLPSESTVENIALHIKRKFCTGVFSACGIRAYEGISKGSCVP